MTLNQLISRVTNREGKKVSVSVGNVREVMKCLKAEFQSDPVGVWLCLAKYFCKGE